MSFQIANKISRKRIFKGGVLVFFLIILSAIVLLPGVLFEKQGMQEPWTLFRLSRVELSLSENSITPIKSSASSYTPERLAEDFLYYAFSDIKYFTPEWLSVLSLGTLIVPLVYFSFAYHISKSLLISIGLGIYGSWYYPRLVSQYGVQTYVWTNLLFLGFLFFFYHWLERKKSVYTIAMLVIYVVTFLFYQTTPLWMITISIIAFVLQSLSERKGNLRNQASWAIPVFMGVMYFTFDTVFWGNFMQRIASESTTEFWMQSFITRVVSPLFPKNELSLLPYQISVLSPKIATWSTLISYLLMVLPVGYWIVFKVFRAIKTKSISSFANNNEDIFSWAILGAFLVHVIGYTSYGAISIRIIPLAFPIVILMILKDLKYGRALSSAFSVLLAVVSVVGFLSFIQTISPDIKPSELGFVPDLLPDRTKLLADATTFGAIQLIGAQQDKVFDLVWIDSNIYNTVVNSAAKNVISADYFAIELHGKPVTSANWASFQPWSVNLVDINRNKNLNKIYESDNLIIINKVGDSLPISKGFANPPTKSEIPFLENFSKHFFLFVLILLLPGLFIFYLIQRYSLQNNDDSLSFFFVSIVFSICILTLIGYLVNFTFLGLKTFLPIYFLTTLVLFLITVYYAFVQKREFKLPIRGLLAAFVLILVWSVMSSVAENERSSIKAQYTEFFVTRSMEAIDHSIVYHIVNRSKQSQEFNLDLLMDGQTIDNTITGEIKPGSIFTFRVPVDNHLEGKQFVAQLSKGNVIQKELHFVYTGAK